MSAIHYMSQEGLDKLKNELAEALALLKSGNAKQEEKAI